MARKTCGMTHVVGGIMKGAALYVARHRDNNQSQQGSTNHTKIVWSNCNIIFNSGIHFFLLFRHTRQIDKFLAPAGFLTCGSTRFPTFPAIASGFSGALSAYSRGGGCSFKSRYTVDPYCIPIQSPIALLFYGEPLHIPSDHLTFKTSSQFKICKKIIRGFSS